MNSFQNTITEMKNAARANKLNQYIIFLGNLIFLILIIFLGLSSTTCGSAKNYLSPEGPKYTIPYAQNQFDFDNFIKVISFNIKLAKNIDRAIYELKYYPELKYADLILLQEMDEIGTDKIAKILKYN